jgi:hypothetical protein
VRKGVLIATRVIDVGCSTRLFNALIAQIVLRPILDNSDYDRQFRLKPNGLSHILDMTLEQLIDQQWYQQTMTHDCLLNFTDVLYYIPDSTLFKAVQYMQNGIVAVGTLHVFAGGNTEITIDNQVLGLVKMEEKYSMKVVGNNSTYVHYNRFPQLYSNNTYNMVDPNYNFVLVVTKIREVSFTGSKYIAVTITKSNTFSFSNTINLVEKQDLIEIPMLGVNISRDLYNNYKKTLLEVVPSMDSFKELSEDTLVTMYKLVAKFDPNRKLSDVKEILNFVVSNEL